MNISKLGIFLRGMIMGVAEIVPGISGGTVAFITGIYAKLVSSIASFGVGSIRLLPSPKEFYEYHNLGFLLTLFSGMVIGVLVFSNVMNFLLKGYGPIVWGMFFGLILGSVFLIGKERNFIRLLTYGALGLCLGLFFVSLPESKGNLDYMTFFMVSMLAVCAWILPGISGSFVLLIFGYYSIVIEAVSNVRVDVLIVLFAGLASGLLMFSKALSWLLANYEDQLLSLLTGIMLGSLLKLWPWHLPDEQGLSALVSPSAYSVLVGEPPFTSITIAAFFLGIFIIWLSAIFKAP